MPGNPLKSFLSFTYSDQAKDQWAEARDELLKSNNFRNNDLFRGSGTDSGGFVLARALFDNGSDWPDELGFRRGDVLIVLEKDVGGAAGWWLCALDGKTGIVPGNRLELISGEQLQSNALVDDDGVVMHDEAADSFSIPASSSANTNRSSHLTIATNKPNPATTLSQFSDSGIYSTPPSSNNAFIRSDNDDGIYDIPTPMAANERRTARVNEEAEEAIYDMPGQYNETVTPAAPIGRQHPTTQAASAAQIRPKRSALSQSLSNREDHHRSSRDTVDRRDVRQFEYDLLGDHGDDFSTLESAASSSREQRRRSRSQPVPIKNRIRQRQMVIVSPPSSPPKHQHNSRWRQVEVLRNEDDRGTDHMTVGNTTQQHHSIASSLRRQQHDSTSTITDVFDEGIAAEKLRDMEILLSKTASRWLKVFSVAHWRSYDYLLTNMSTIQGLGGDLASIFMSFNQYANKLHNSNVIPLRNQFAKDSALFNSLLNCVMNPSWYVQQSPKHLVSVLESLTNNLRSLLQTANSIVRIYITDASMVVVVPKFETHILPDFAGGRARKLESSTSYSNLSRSATPTSSKAGSRAYRPEAVYSMPKTVTATKIPLTVFDDSLTTTDGEYDVLPNSIPIEEFSRLRKSTTDSRISERIHRQRNQSEDTSRILEHTSNDNSDSLSKICADADALYSELKFVSVNLLKSVEERRPGYVESCKTLIIAAHRLISVAASLESSHSDQLKPSRLREIRYYCTEIQHCLRKLVERIRNPEKQEQFAEITAHINIVEHNSAKLRSLIIDSAN